MKRSQICCCMLISLFLLAVGTVARPAMASTQAVNFPSPEDRAEIERLIALDISRHTEVMAFQIYEVRTEEILFSDDVGWALATLAYFEPGSEQAVATEPGLALAHRLAEGWQVTLQADSDWTTMLDQAPESLIPAETKRLFYPPSEDQAKDMAKAIGGYKLPWPAGQQKRLTQSVGHGGSMRYAFDFIDTANPMYPLVASRTGVVKYAVWTYPNGYYDGDANHANYLVLEDTSTVPTTYQVYLHLAQNSIPTALRTPGTRVYRGQFLGVADDTGYSTGSHLHFQVHTNAASWWGNSIDITFDDVSINGGRPRLPEEASWYGGSGARDYTSGNSSGNDFTAPTADITAPAARESIGVTTVRLSGWASDSGGSGFSHAYFIANYGNGWEQVGPIFSTSPFIYDWNLCSSGVPVGAISISLRAWDRDGNPAAGYPGLRTILHATSCPPPAPACTVTANQAAVFSEKDFGGLCAVMDVGNYPNASQLMPVGGKNAMSVRVGAGVFATLYGGNDYSGRAETLAADDRNLDDNSIGGDTLVSLRVAARNTPPEIAAVLWPPNDTVFARGDALVFAWRPGVSSTAYTVEWDTLGPLGMQNLPYRALDGNVTGSPGNKLWYFLPHSCSGSTGCVSDWTTGKYTVIAPAALPAALAAPVTDNLEGDVSRWRATGLWRLGANLASSGTHAWIYNQPSDETYDTGANAGFLTSPPISIPGSGYALHFLSWSDTETTGPHWDQRWVQISTDGGNFTNILQMTEDKQLAWVSSPRIDLGAYAGHSIRVRFAFFSLDETRNRNRGWAIDDLVVEQSAAPACSDALEPNNAPGAASPLAVNTPLKGQICPTGDADYFRFSAAAATRIVARLEGLGSLSPSLAILDSDGTSVLAHSDGSSVGYLIPQTGNYYVKVRSRNHPSEGGSDKGYTIRLLTDSDSPTLAWKTPSQSGGFISTATKNLEVTAADNGGIQTVEFFRHDSNWNEGTWVPVCADADPAGGWTCPLDVHSLPEGTGLAFLARVSDWVGNQSAAAVWSITNDRTAPVLNVAALPASQNSTVVNLKWTASDAVSGLHHFRIRVRVDGGDWSIWMDNIPATTTQTPYAGGAGHTYGFRITAYDKAWNTTTVERSIVITGCKPDSYENDDTAATAHLLEIGSPQTHGICGSGDKDWEYIQAASGKTYILQALSKGPTAWTVLELFDTDGVTLLRQALPPPGSLVGQGATLCWSAPRDGIFFLRTRHQDPSAAGDETAYTVSINLGYCSFLPGVLR